MSIKIELNGKEKDYVEISCRVRLVKSEIDQFPDIIGLALENLKYQLQKEIKTNASSLFDTPVKFDYSIAPKPFELNPYDNSAYCRYMDNSILSTPLPKPEEPNIEIDSAIKDLEL